MNFRVTGSLYHYLLVFFSIFLGACSAHSQTLTLHRAIELALEHSTASVSSRADVQRAFASYRAIRNNCVPQVTVGSGLGYSYGFPLSLEGAAPSIVNVVGQSTVWNPSLKQFQNAARTEWHAAQLQ